MKTKYGIYLDLNETPYRYKKYKKIFYFSSALHLKKFTSSISEFVNIEIAKISIKYNNDIIKDYPELYTELSLYLAIALYKKVENRGFKIENEMD